MELLRKIKETINKYSMLTRGDNLLIGLSGGADSVCLSIILSKLREDFNLTLSAVYIDHGLRPDETGEEKSFCKALCDGLGIGFYIKTIDARGYAKEKKLNLQEAGRELRYQVYKELCKEIKATKIALGHNADDQAETFLMRLLRGSGPTGLSGIPPTRIPNSKFQIPKVKAEKNILIIRPLIEIERKEIEEFLSGHWSLVTGHPSLPFIVDSSNLKKDYFRNWVRLVVIPELKRENPTLIKNILRLMEIIREEDAYLELIVTKTLMKLISRKDDDMIELFLLPLETMEKVLLRRILRRAIDAVKGLKGIDFTHIEDIIGLIKSGKSGDRLYLPKGIKAIRGYSTLLLTSKPPLRLLSRILTIPVDATRFRGEVSLEEIGMVLKAEISCEASCREEIGDKLYDGKSSAIFDFDRLLLPVEIRSRKSGDSFYPSGFGKRKKLQDFFVDSKIPRDKRDAIPILTSGGNIMWVVGHRTDERFKVKEDTKKFLIVEVLKLERHQ